jgi:hypothetical protein
MEMEQSECQWSKTTSDEQEQEGERVRLQQATGDEGRLSSNGVRAEEGTVRDKERIRAMY